MNNAVEKNYQKVCDVFDLFEPALIDVVRNSLRTVPSLRRRAWEFATIFLALKQAGMLDGTKTGLGMGVGTERLIYALEPFVKKAFLTDLYQTDSRWVAVRTTDPNAMLRDRAPWPVDWSKLTAMRMDMRELTFEDRSVDFAWSTGAIEHIGSDQDFIRHFSEVGRVLKEGGVYAFTTAVAFEDKTVRFPHNYLFHPQHLVDLIAQAGLQAAPVFDCSVGNHSLNDPAFEDLTEFGVNMPRQDTPHLISFRRGILTTANCMVLRKATGPVTPAVVEGFDETRKRFQQRSKNLVARVYTDEQALRLTLDKHGGLRSPMMYFGGLPMSVTAVGKAESMRVISRRRGEDKDVRVEATIPFADGQAKFDVTADPDRIYKFTVTGHGGSKVIVSAQRASAESRGSATA